MQTVETTSSVEARRCRRAQYCGRTAELSLNGSKILGMVRSVQEDRSSIPQRWIVTIVPTVEKPPLVGWQYRRAPKSLPVRKKKPPGVNRRALVAMSKLSGR